MNIKRLICCVIAFTVVFSSCITYATPLNKFNNKDKKIRVTITDSIMGTVYHKYIDEKDFNKIILLIQDYNQGESFYQNMDDKLTVLTNLNIINSDTKNCISDSLKTLKNRFIHNRLAAGVLFDMSNIFNGIFFGIKGEKTYNLYDLPISRFPFFDSNITVLFSTFTRYTGSGSIFTIGFLGFNYIYDFDMSKYEFPHFSDIAGSVIGFTGITLELESTGEMGEEYAGLYFLGIGMSIATFWNNLEE